MQSRLGPGSAGRRRQPGTHCAGILQFMLCSVIKLGNSFTLLSNRHFKDLLFGQAECQQRHTVGMSGYGSSSPPRAVSVFWSVLSSNTRQ